MTEIQPQPSRITWGFVARVLIKAAVLFALVNLVFALVNPLPALRRVSIYNVLVPGRERLPYGETPASYNLSLDSIEAMFASHAISRPKAADEYRVILLGDSSTWGILLTNAQTLAGQLNAADLSIDGREVRAYNLGHPLMSVTKDLMLLDYALQFQPDAILWLVTLESFPLESQFSPPLVQRNPEPLRRLVLDHGLADNPDPIPELSFWDRTLIGQRRAIADWWRLQAFGWMWNATGIDQVIGEYDPVTNDLDADERWKGFAPPDALTETDIALDRLSIGAEMAAEQGIPIIVVNEPIFRATGTNNDIRYNVWYPRWTYDAYRGLLSDVAAREGWHYLDLWDALPPTEFTDSPVHRTPEGEQEIAAYIAEFVKNIS